MQEQDCVLGFEIMGQEHASLRVWCRSNSIYSSLSVSEMYITCTSLEVLCGEVTKWPRQKLYEKLGETTASLGLSVQV